MAVKNQIWRPPPIPKKFQHLVRMKAVEQNKTIEKFLVEAIEKALKGD